MKNSLPCLSVVVALAAGGAALSQLRAQAAESTPAFAPAEPAGTTADATPPTAAKPAAASGNRLLAQAINQLERHDSVTARLRHQVSLGSQQHYGVGSYWQQGNGENLRVRLELQIAGQQATLLQVCNSRFLWVDRQLPTGRTVSRIDLRQLRADPVLMGTSLESLQPGKASWSPLQPELAIHCGGLASLMAALSEGFNFMPPQAMRLAVASAQAGPATNIPVFAVVGHWKPEKLAALAPSAGQPADATAPASASLNSLPERLPQEVLLLVGQSDLFPYRVEYRRLETDPNAPANAAAAPYQLSAQPLVVLELSDVTFDVPIHAGQFDYNPRDVDWVDQTATQLQRLRERRQAEVAARDSAPPR